MMASVAIISVVVTIVGVIVGIFQLIRGRHTNRDMSKAQLEQQQGVANIYVHTTGQFERQSDGR